MASGKSTLMSGRVDMVVEFCFQGKETIFVIPENAVFQDCFAEVSFVTYEGNQLSYFPNGYFFKILWWSYDPYTVFP